jgi:hypothetical protein
MHRERKATGEGKPWNSRVIGRYPDNKRKPILVFAGGEI